METKTLRTLALENFKQPKPSPYSTHRKHYIFVHSLNTLIYGDINLRALGPHIIFLPENIKSTPFLIILKDFIKNWFGPKCKSKLSL